MERMRNTGFTLVELMIVLAIVAILGAIAAPAYRTMMLNNRLSAATNDLLADLALARSESARRGKRITLCISTDSSACATSGSAWEGGRIVFEDINADGVRDNSDTILRVTQKETGSSVRITAANFKNAAGTDINYFIQYRPNGALNSSTTGTFTLCDERTGNFGRVIEVGFTGRATLKPQPWAACS